MVIYTCIEVYLYACVCICFASLELFTHISKIFENTIVGSRLGTVIGIPIYLMPSHSFTLPAKGILVYRQRETAGPSTCRMTAQEVLRQHRILIHLDGVGVLLLMHFQAMWVDYSAGKERCSFASSQCGPASKESRILTRCSQVHLLTAILLVPLLITMIAATTTTTAGN